MSDDWNFWNDRDWDWEFDDFCEFGEDTIAEHYEAVVNEPVPYMWYAHDGKRTDLRQAPPQYLLNLKAWMEKNHTENLQYKETTQYKLVARKVEENDKWINFARNVLSPKGKE